jgi:hypothetical protein
VSIRFPSTGSGSGSSTPTGVMFSSGGAVPGGTTDTLLATVPTISAGSLAVGQCYRLDLDGNFDAIATSGTFTIKIKHNGTTATNVQIAGSQTSAATAKPWIANLRLYIEATGSSGVITTSGMGTNIGTGGNAGTPVTMADPSRSIDMSSGLTVTITITNGTANAGNLTRLLHGVLVRVA